MSTPINNLKTWFNTGLKPTQEQFWAWMDSFWHKDEKIPMSSVEGIDTALENKADASQLASKADLVGGKVPLSQLPFGDDVLNFDSFSVFPQTGEVGKFYVDLTDDKPYLWDSETSTYKPAGTDATWKATVDAALAQIDNKVDKPTTDGNWVLSKLGSIFSWVDASNFGKNVANTLLDTVANAGVNMKANWKIATNNFLFFIEGLADKSTDTTYNMLLTQNSDGQIAKTNGKTLITSMPTLLSDTEKTTWKTEMNGGWTTNTMSVALITPPVVDNQDKPYWIGLVGSNLNLNPTNFSIQIVDEPGTNVIATIPNSQVQLYTNGIDLVFWYNFKDIPLGNYRLRLNNGVVSYTTGSNVTLNVVNKVNNQSLSNIVWNALEYTPGSNVLSLSNSTVAYVSSPENKAYANDAIVVASVKSNEIISYGENFYLEFIVNSTGSGRAAHRVDSRFGLCDSSNNLILSFTHILNVRHNANNAPTDNRGNIYAQDVGVSGSYLSIDNFTGIIYRNNGLCTVIFIPAKGSPLIATVSNTNNAFSFHFAVTNNIAAAQSSFTLKTLYKF